MHSFMWRWSIKNGSSKKKGRKKARRKKVDSAVALHEIPELQTLQPSPNHSRTELAERFFSNPHVDDLPPDHEGADAGAEEDVDGCAFVEGARRNGVDIQGVDFVSRFKFLEIRVSELNTLVQAILQRLDNNTEQVLRKLESFNNEPAVSIVHDQEHSMPNPEGSLHTHPIQNVTAEVCPEAEDQMQPVNVQVNINQSIETIEDHYEGVTLIRNENVVVPNRITDEVSDNLESYSPEQEKYDEREARFSQGHEDININETGVDTAEDNALTEEENSSDEAWGTIELAPPLPPKKAVAHNVEEPSAPGMEGAEQSRCIQKRSETADLIKVLFSVRFSDDIDQLLLSLLPSVEGEFSDVKMKVLTILFRENSLTRDSRTYKFYEALCRDPHKIQTAIKNEHDNRQRVEDLFYSYLSDLMKRNRFNKQVVMVITKTSDPVLDPLLFHMLTEFKHKSREECLPGTKSLSYAFINAVFLHVYFSMEQSEIAQREDALLHVLKLLGNVTVGLKRRRKESLAHELKKHMDHSDYERIESFYLEYEGEIIRSLLIRCGEVWNDRLKPFQG